MWRNFVVAASNFTCIYPITKAVANGDYVTAAAISFVSAASIISHLVENHKHGMPGIGLSKRVSYILNRFDVLGCGLVTCRLGYLYLSKYGLSLSVFSGNRLLLLGAGMAFLFLRVSEHDKYNAKLRNIYMVTHCVWHLAIFKIIGWFLMKIIYV